MEISRNRDVTTRAQQRLEALESRLQQLGRAVASTDQTLYHPLKPTNHMAPNPPPMARYGVAPAAAGAVDSAAGEVCDTRDALRCYCHQNRTEPNPPRS